MRKSKHSKVIKTAITMIAKKGVVEKESSELILWFSVASIDLVRSVLKAFYAKKKLACS